MELNAASKILVQGIMEPLGQAYVPWMVAYGSPVVAGISPGRGGSTLADVPVFDLVSQAIAANGHIDATVICTQPYDVLDAATEAIAANVPQIIILTEGVPPLDMVQLIRRAEAVDALVVGPNSPGIMVPGQLLLGTYPQHCYQPGRVGIVSRSSTLTFEVAAALTQADLGQSICVGLGSESITGSTFAQWLQRLDEDDTTDVIVLIGEPGGNEEEKAAAYIQASIDKPVVAYIAGRHVPSGSYIGHLGAIIAAQTPRPKQRGRTQPAVSGDFGAASAKVMALRQAGVAVADRISDVPKLVHDALQTLANAATDATPGDAAGEETGEEASVPTANAASAANARPKRRKVARSPRSRSTRDRGTDPAS